VLACPGDGHGFDLLLLVATRRDPAGARRPCIVASSGRNRRACDDFSLCPRVQSPGRDVRQSDGMFVHASRSAVKAITVFAVAAMCAAPKTAPNTRYKLR
jgi:hypothetical protein